MQGMQVQSLVGELRSHMLQGEAKKKKKVNWGSINSRVNKLMERPWEVRSAPSSSSPLHPSTPPPLCTVASIIHSHVHSRSSFECLLYSSAEDMEMNKSPSLP